MLKRTGFLFLGFISANVYFVIACLMSDFLIIGPIKNLILFQLIPVLLLCLIWKKLRIYFYWVLAGILLFFPFSFFLIMWITGDYDGWI